MKIGMIGCGNMGGALLNAAIAAGYRDAVCVSDPYAGRAESYGVAASDNVQIARECTFLFLGVKPQMLDGVLNEIQPILAARTDRFVLVSMAAGVSMAHIRAIVEAPLIRIMPNTPVSVGEGMIVYDSVGVTDAEIAEFRAILAKAGRLDPLPERLIDAAGAISGCGPAFAFLFAEALADGGVECGLPRDKAALYAAQMLLGSAKLLLNGGHPGVLKDAVCSPGGTTIAGVHALESGAFRANVMNAVTAAYEKTLALASLRG